MNKEIKKKLYKSMLCTLSLISLSGCASKKEETKQISTYEYYIENNGVYTKLENVEVVMYDRYGIVYVIFNDGTKLKVALTDFYQFDISSETQKELVKTLTGN